MRRTLTIVTVVAGGALLVAWRECGTHQQTKGPAAPQARPVAPLTRLPLSPTASWRKGEPHAGAVTPRPTAVADRNTTRDEAFFEASLRELVRVEEAALRAVAANDDELARLLALSRAARARVDVVAAEAAKRARQGTVDEQFPDLDTRDIDAEMKAILGDRYSEYVLLETSMAAEALEAAVMK